MTKLCADGIYVELAGEAFELRPSLRASMRLVRRHGLPALVTGIDEFNTTIITDVLREAAIKPAMLLAEIAAIGLGTVRNRLTDPLTQFVLAIAGIDPDDPNDTTPTKPAPGKPMTPNEYHTRLFEIATGWLGWSPEQAWNATPAEIVAAHRGHIERLQAIHGKPDEKPAEPAPYTPEKIAEIVAAGKDPAFDRAGLMKLKAALGV